MSDVAEGPDWWLASDGKWYPPQPAYQGAAPAAQLADAKSQAFVLLGGAAAVILGAFLAWATVDVVGERVGDKAGTDGDGVITVVFGVAVAVFGVLCLGAARRRWYAVTALVLAALVAVIAVLDITDINSKFGDEAAGSGVDVNIGIGLWLTLAGGLAAAVGAVLVLLRTPKAPAV